MVSVGELCKNQGSECNIDGLFNELVKNTINEQINNSYIPIEDLCNLEYQTCVYENRQCNNTLYGPVCECQAGFVPLNGPNGDCTSNYF